MLTFLRQLIVWIVTLAFLGQAVAFSQPAQAIPLQLTSLASADVVMLLDSRNYKTVGKDNEYVSLAAEAVEKGSRVKELAFSDTNQFYKELTDALKSGEPVNIITDYTSYDDFPLRLKQIFKVNTHTISNPQSENYLHLPAAGAYAVPAPIASPFQFLPIPAKLDSKWLIIPVSTAVGAGAGGALGGLAVGIGAIPGTLLGGAFGLAAGAVSVAIIDKDEVLFEINPTRGIIITVRPVNS